MSEKKINNDADLIEAKINLRIQSLPDKPIVKVLEAFGGDGILWGAVQRRCPGREIKILSMDKSKYKRVQLQGDNMKFLLSLNLSEFDIIDLDAYGAPVKQLEVLFNKSYRGLVHCTQISTMSFNPNGFLSKMYYGFSKEIIQKAPSLFAASHQDQFFNYLQKRGIKKVTGLFTGRKNYMYFIIR